MKNRTNMHKILITDDAMQVIRKEAIHFKRMGVEAGGSLVGIQGVDTTIILYAIPTGPAASQGGAHIVTDDDYQNECIRYIYRHYAKRAIKVVYLIDWHVHPMYLPSLSSTDTNSCREILKDSDHSYLQGLPLILITFQSNRLMHVPFWITLNGHRLNIEDADLEIVSPRDKRITRALRGHDYVPLDTLRTSKTDTRRVQPSAALPLFASITPERLKAETTEMKDLIGVTPSLKKICSGCQCLEVKTEEHTLVAVLPPEFPINPPSCFVRSDGSAFEEFFPTRPWNSFFRIADIFQQKLQSIKGRGK